MSSTTHDLRLFGLDLRTLWQDMRRPWQDMHRWPLLAWMAPEVPVRLLHSDGRETVWLGTKSQIKTPSAKEAVSRFVAVELPDELVLRRKLVLPEMPDAQTADAVSLETHTVSPFAADDLVWGYAVHPGAKNHSQIELVLASRKQVEQYLHTQAPRLNGVVPEVWALAGGITPVALAGFGEKQRAGYMAGWRRIGYGLLLLVAGLLAAIAVTPTAQLRMRAVEAVNAYTAVQQRTQPLAQQREVLVKTTERLAELKEALSVTIDPLRVIDLLTQALPDDTSLQSLQIQGLKVTMAGLTTNAAALMQHLSTQPGMRDVKAPTAATRRQGASQENFTVEFLLEPKVFAPAPAVAGEAAPNAPAAVPAGEAAAAIAPASAPASVPNRAVAPVNTASNAPVFMPPGAISPKALQKATPSTAKPAQ